MQIADVRKTQAQPVERPDVEALEHEIRIADFALYEYDWKAAVVELIAYVRALEAR